jgi:crotonobetainyl-CoA:carnitine CoA-transferase CaiB-like acyl-CoA transferase
MTAEKPLRANTGSLTGLKVVDLTQMLAGPYCTMLLADQGANVVKIEPFAGDAIRTMGPNRADTVDSDFGGYFQSINRGKRSLALDLKTEEGKVVLRALVAQADVLVENFRSGVMDRLGLGYESLHEINPRLVYGAIRGFGDPRSGESPYNDWPAFDVVAQAMGGMMSVTGPDANTPLKVGPGVGDLVPAMFATIGILSAVRHADHTGEGQFVDVAMYDGILALCERIVYQYSYTGNVPVPEGNYHPIFCPFGLFEAKDGWAAIGCPIDHFWGTLAQIMEREDLRTDPRLADSAGRSDNAVEVNAAVSAWTLVRTKDQIAQLLGGKVPFGPVNKVDEIVNDPHVAIRSMIAEVPHPGTDVPVQIANTPIHMSKTPGGVRERAPVLGEHTVEVLTDWGFSADEIQRLRADDIVR